MSFLGSQAQLPVCLNTNGSSASIPVTTASTSKVPTSSLNTAKSNNYASLYQNHQSYAQNNYSSNSQTKYSSANYHKNSGLGRKSSINSHNTSKQQLMTKNFNDSTTYLHNNTSNFGTLKTHNLSMCNNTMAGNKISINDQGCYQFDEILKNIDRQIETQINPVKTFNLTSSQSTPDKQPLSQAAIT